MEANASGVRECVVQSRLSSDAGDLCKEKNKSVKNNKCGVGGSGKVVRVW